jgi:hypothetical protein
MKMCRIVDILSFISKIMTFLLHSEFLWLQFSSIWPADKIGLGSVSYGLIHCLLSWSPSPDNEIHYSSVSTFCFCLFQERHCWSIYWLTFSHAWSVPSHWPLCPLVRGLFFLMHLVISVACKHGPRTGFLFPTYLSSLYPHPIIICDRFPYTQRDKA